MRALFLVMLVGGCGPQLVYRNGPALDEAVRATVYVEPPTALGPWPASQPAFARGYAEALKLKTRPEEGNGPILETDATVEDRGGGKAQYRIYVSVRDARGLLWAATADTSAGTDDEGARAAGKQLGDQVHDLVARSLGRWAPLL